MLRLREVFFLFALVCPVALSTECSYLGRAFVDECDETSLLQLQSVVQHQQDPDDRRVETLDGGGVELQKMDVSSRGPHVSPSSDEIAKGDESETASKMKGEDLYAAAETLRKTAAKIAEKRGRGGDLVTHGSEEDDERVEKAFHEKLDEAKDDVEEAARLAKQLGTIEGKTEARSGRDDFRDIIDELKKEEKEVFKKRTKDHREEVEQEVRSPDAVYQHDITDSSKGDIDDSDDYGINGKLYD